MKLLFKKMLTVFLYSFKQLNDLKALWLPVVAIGNFMFILLYRLANAYESEQYKVKKKWTNSFYLHFSSFQEGLIIRGVKLYSTDMPSKIAQAHNR